MKCKKTLKDKRLFSLYCNKTKDESINFKQKTHKHYKYKPNKRNKYADGNVGLYKMLNAMLDVK